MPSRQCLIAGLLSSQNPNIDQINDIIEYVPDIDTGILISTNAGEQSGRGIELEARWRIHSRVELRGHFAKLESENINGEAVTGNPNQLAYIQAISQLTPNWSLFTSIRKVGERPRASGDSRDPLAGYQWLRTRLAYQQESYELSLLADNVLDEDAREPSDVVIADDYPLQGRSVTLQLKLNF